MEPGLLALAAITLAYSAMLTAVLLDTFLLVSYFRSRRTALAAA